MLERFRHKVEELRGLIADLRSASVSMDQGGSQGCRKNPSHFVGPSPCGQGGSTLSAPLTSTFDNRCLLAVSGGIDSMCLADLWLRCFGAGSFAIAHCNFHLRGEESDGDEALVTKWAEENGVRMHRVDFDTVSYASENGLSIEMAARELRYRWFGELCQKHDYEAVVVAHHADDNAETLVLNMVRGAGLKGLTGMKPVSPLPYLSCHCDKRPTRHSDERSTRHCDERPSRHCDERPTRHCDERPTRHCEERSDVAILRPLLTFTRKQIEGHVFAWKVPYREDSTNSSVEYRRNSIRHEVFPLFERMNPSYVRTLNREMTYLSDASSIVEEWCRMQLSAVIDPHVGTSSLLRMTPEGPHTSLRGFEEAVAISIPRLLEIPQWRYLLYYILEPYGFNTSVLASLENLLMSDRTLSGKRFESSGYVLRTERQSLVVVPKMAGQAGHDVPVEPGHDVPGHPVHDVAVIPDHDVPGHPAHDVPGHPAHDVAVIPDHDVAVIPDLIGDPFVPVRGAGAYHCNGRRFVVEVLPWSAEMPLQQPAGTLIFDADKLKFPFVCRGWRNGDWMIPLGMKGKKKLSDMFTDLKYNYQDKENALVLVDCTGDRAEKQHIAALLGARIDDHYKVSDRTTSIIRITL